MPLKNDKNKKVKTKLAGGKAPPKVNRNVSKTDESISIKTPSKKIWTELDDKAVLIQKLVRKFLARKKLEKLKKQKAIYENEMEELERKAYLEIVKREQLEYEKQRKKEEEERKIIVEFNRRKKVMMESAFDGELNEIKSVLSMVENDDNKNGIGHDLIGKNLRKRNLLNMVNCEDPNKNTPISEAASGGHAEVVQFLIQKGANINCKGQFKRTPLYRAAFAGHFDVCEMLLKNGADPKLYADDAQTPFDVATSEIVRELFANWNYEDTEKLLKKIELSDAKLAEENKKSIEAELNNLDAQITKAQKEHDNAQHRLQKSYCELNKRIYEHDKAVEKNFEKTDITLQCVHDAEFEVESARMEMDKLRNVLANLKLQKREKQKEEGVASGEESSKPGIECQIRDLDDVIFKDVGNKIESSGKWPLIIDPSGQATTFLRYRDTNYVNALNLSQMEPEKLRLALLGAIRYGKSFILDLMEILSAFQSCKDRFTEIQPGLLEDIINKSITKPEKYLKLIRANDDPEYDKNKFIESRICKFKFILLTSNSLPPPDLIDIFYPIWIRIN